MLSRLLFLLLLPFMLFAIEGAVELHVNTKQQYFISEKITLTLKLKTSGFSIGDVRVNSSDSDDFILIAPLSASYLETQNINDEQWQVAVYEYALYPLHSGQLQLKPFSVTFSGSMGYGTPKSNFSLKTEAHSFNIAHPKGIKKDSFVLSTTRLHVNVSYQPQRAEFFVGDAIERHVIQEALDVPDLLLHPVTTPTMDGLTSYPSEPNLHVKESVATREDRQSFVFTKEGNITIAGMTLLWFNPQTQTLHKETVQDATFLVQPNPLSKTAPAKEETKSSIFPLLMIQMILIFIVLFFVYPKIKAYKTLEKKQFKQSEEGKFKVLMNSKDIKTFYKNLYLWGDSFFKEIRPFNLKTFSLQYPELKDDFHLLSVALTDETVDVNISDIKKKLVVIRQKKLLLQNNSSNALERSINPL